jgi:hypothetical protein
MLSPEPFMGPAGYPLLLASGETADGRTHLIDRQHPHDLFMEIALGYQRAVSKNVAVQLYGGPVGEPALGPVAFPHRVSAMSNPFAPISHHWLDATHIAFGVVTAGLYGQHWKVEGSAFNGREPDDNRYDINLNRLDSYSGRAWFLPSDHWALQASVGRLNNVETDLTTGAVLNLTRATASLSYVRTDESERTWAATFAWGTNIEADQTTHAFIAEGNLMLQEKNAVFARAEINGKTGHDLVLSSSPTSPLQAEVFTLGKLAVGYSHSFGPVLGFTPGIGASASLSLMPTGLQPYYGTTTAPGFAVIMSLRPPRMGM